MATSLQIRNYMKQHGVNRNEAKAALRKAESGKDSLVIMDLEEAITGKVNAYKNYEIHSNICITGRIQSNIMGKTGVCLLITNTMKESAAQETIKALFKQFKADGCDDTLLVWFPINDIKETVVCDMHKNTKERAEMLGYVMREVGLHQIKDLQECAAAIFA